MLCRTQALIGVHRVTGLVLVVADGQRGGHAAGQIGADQRARLNLIRRIHRGRVDENRPVANVSILGAAAVISIVCLRQTPNVVIGHRLSVPTANSNLVIKNLVVVIPHALQPIEPELPFRNKV